MKVSNNALNFLLAQYRAIFKRAYIKGIASAVILTAGLAAGQAQAADTNLTDEILAKGLDKTYNITGVADAADPNYTKMTIDGAVTGFNGTINITSSGQATQNIISGDGSLIGDGSIIINTKQYKVEDSTFPGLRVEGSTQSKEVKVDIGSVDLQIGSISLAPSASGSTINFNADKITIGSADIKDQRAVVNLGNQATDQDVSGSVTFGRVATATEKGTTLTLDGRGSIQMNGSSGSSAVDLAADTVIMNGGTIRATNLATAGVNKITSHQVTMNAGNLEVEASGAVGLTLDLTARKALDSNGLEQTTGEDIDGHFDVLGGNVKLANKLTIANGTLDIADEAVLTATADTGGIIVSGSSGKTPILALSSRKLTSFLTADEPVTKGTQDNAGGVLLSGGGTLLIDNAANELVDIAAYKFSGSNTLHAGMISVSGAGNIQGENLAISHELTQTGEAGGTAAGVEDALSVKATNLTLGGGEGFTSATTALGVKDMTAQNVTFLDDSSSNADFTLQDKLVLKATQEITNPYESKLGSLTYAATGTIKGDVIVSGGSSKPLQVFAGNYSTSDDITISGGKVIVGGDLGSDTDLVDVSLTLGSASVLTLSNSGDLVVDGTDRADLVFDTDVTRKAEAILDISAADLKYEGTSNTIRVQGGTLIMDEDQVQTVLNSATAGVGINVKSDGYVLVEGNIQGSGNTGLDVSKLISGGSAKDGLITFGTASSTGGTLEATGQIWLKTTAAATALNLGDSGALVAETLRLDNVQEIQSSVTSTVREFVVADGTLVAGSSVTTSKTDHNSTLTLGDGASGATLQLGYIEDNVDEWGMPDHTYTTSSDTGIVSQNLSLVGTGADASSLNVVYGTWTAQDISVTGDSGAITVGYNGTTKYDANGNEVVFSAALKADELSLRGTNSKVTVNDNGTMSVNGLTMSNGTVTVHGQMTVAGVEPASDATDPNYGVNIGGGSFIVEGRNAQLTFGEQAVKNITINGNEVTAENFISNITVEDYATLRLEFANGTSFTEAALSDLRKDLLANAADGLALDDGYIHLGNGTIAGLNVSGGTIDWDVLSKFKDIKDIRTTGMDSATLTNVDEQDIITANVGNIQANGNTQNVQLSDSVLSSAKDLGNGTSAFITNANNEVIGATVQAGAVVGFNGGGAVRDLVINGNDSTVDDTNTVVNIAASGEAVTSFESIKGGERTELNVDGVTTVAKNMSVGTLNLNQSLTVAGDTTIEDGLYSDPESTIPAVLNTTRLTVKGDTEFDGNINATGKAVFDSTDGNDQDTYLAGNNSFAVGVDFIEGNVELAHGTTETTELTLNNVEYLLLSENAQLTADKISVTGSNASDTIISVGEVAGQDGSETWGDSTGYLTAGNIDLNGATLIVDPAYGSAASIAVTDTLGNITAQQNHDQYAGGVLNGDFVAARNGIIAVGVADTQDATAIEQVQDAFATLMDNNGSLKADDVGAIVWVGKNIQVQDGNKIVADSTKNRDEYLQATGTYAQNVAANDVYIAKNSALAVDKAALSQVYNGNTQAAIHFDTAEASLYNEEGGKVILTGDDFRTGDTITLFTDEGGTGHEGIWIRGNDLEVSTLNGLLHFVLAKDTETTGQTLSLNTEQVKYVFNDSSAPVKNSLVAYAAKNNNWAGTAAEADPLVGAQVSGVTTTDGENYTNVADGTPVSDDSNLMSLQGEDGTYTVYEKPYNYFLDEVVKGYSGAAAEAVARLGVYGGAPQAAIKAGQSSTDAIAARFGIGSALSNLTVAGNSQGAALWLAPVYKTSDSDGFDAQGVDYGVNVDLYGVALGADFTLANGMTFGAMFNVGSGEVDGEGAASPVTNDFDYYGFGAYAGYTVGQFSVVGDISYTVADNEVEASTSVDHIGATMDSTNLSVGVTGKYELSFNGVNVTPHVGLRYSNIDLDDYTIDGEEVVGSADSDKLNLFSIPVGVTIAKEFKGESWTVAPSLDLTLTGQFGDDELDGSVSWAGVENLSTNTTTEVFDNFTYGATLGVEAQSVGGVALGINVGYTGSSNVDEFGVNANARFVF